MSWPIVKLGDIATTVTKGTTPTTLGYEFAEDGIPFLRAQNLVDGSVSVEADPLFISIEVDDALTRSKIKPGDILIAIAGTIGRAAIVPETLQSANCNQAVAIVRLNDTLDKRYFLHWLSSADALQQITQSKVTGVISNLSLGQIRELQIPLPPLEEQKRIAGILDQADALRRLRARALEKLNTLGQAVFQEMFGSQEHNWPTENITAFAKHSDDIKCGPFGTQLLKSEFTEDGVPLWGIKQVNRHFSIPTEEFVTQKKFEELSGYSLEADDIVMTRKGTVGNCAVYPSEFPVGIMHSDLLRIRVDRARHNPIFLADQLRYSSAFTRQLELISGGAIMPGINVTKLKALTAIHPPKNIQDDYALKVSAISAQRDVVIKAMRASQALFSSLQSAAFQGKL